MDVEDKIKLENALNDYKHLLQKLDGVIKDNPERDNRLWDALVVVKKIPEPEEYSDSCRCRC